MLFTFYSPVHDGGSKDSPVQTAVFNATVTADMPSLDLTGDSPNLDDLLNFEDSTVPRKRDRGERIVWTPEEDEFLKAAVQKYGDKTEKWAKIAACVPGRTNKNCRKRWFHSLDPKLKKGPWTEEEDHLLRTGVEMFKGQWSKIAERIPGRTDDQCAKRWRESLDPLIDRADWTPQDDILLLQRFAEFGSQWQKIALAFPGRPGLHCRNRWRKIQRSLNHMKRASKRRNQMGVGGDSSLLLSETQRLQALLDSHSDDLETDSSYFNAAEDVLLLQDAFLDDDFTLELDEDGLARVAKNSRTDRPDAVEVYAEDEKPYGCAVPECTFESSSPSLLFYHYKASHAGATIEKPFRCTMPGCETRKRYKNINGLQYHVTHAKNSSGHSSGHGHGHGHGHGQGHAHGDEGFEHPRTSRALQQTSPTTHIATIAPHSTRINPSSPLDNGLHISIPNTSFDPSKMPLSNPPTPAELQLQLHQSKKDFVQQHIVPQLSHNAFHIPHDVSPMERSSSSSQSSSGASSPQIQRTVIRCPELGCDKSFQQMSGLTAHMANNHGHRAMTLRSNDAMYGSEAMVIPQDDHVDFDMDISELPSGMSSPMDTGVLGLESALLQNPLDGMGQDHKHMNLDSSPVQSFDASLVISSNSSIIKANGFINSTNPRNNDSNRNNTTFGVTVQDLVFVNHLSSSLQNRVHYGSHINVSANEPIAIQPAVSTNGNTSPTSPTSSSIAAQPSKTVNKVQAARSAAKRLACIAAGCQRSYANSSSLNNHVRNDHPDLYTKPGSGSRTPTTLATSAAQRTAASMEIPHSPVLPRDEGDLLDKPYKCLVPGCGKGYNNINGLKNHLLQTHGSTPKTSITA
ncbi:hypothetical protein BGZ51_003161 [Haplosporangium sp. Z 767]|nr:hypothetical protein BGZ51_003161 [Haplosporangium sp. Z 767]